MSSTSSPRLPAAERRSTILEAGGQLFGDRGYEGTTLDDIAAAAGVTKPIVYRHFGSKQGLYLDLLERHRHDLPTAAGSAPSGAFDEEKLRSMLSVWLDYVEAHSYAWKMLFRDTGGGPDVDSVRLEVQARAREVMADLIRAGADGSIPEGEVEPLAELMRMGMASLVLWWMEHPSVPREGVLAALTRVWSLLLSGSGG